MTHHSQQVLMQDVWLPDTFFPRAQWCSLGVHAALIAALLVPIALYVTSPPPVKPINVSIVPVFDPPALRDLLKQRGKRDSGGSGGDRNPIPPTKGGLAPTDWFQITPPSTPKNDHPALPAPPTLVGPPDLRPQLNPEEYGLPWAKDRTGSQGPGGGNGYGNKGRGGMGDGGEHRGAGDGQRVGIAGREGYSLPTCVYCPNPAFTEEAVKAKHEGTIVLRVMVTADGRAANVTLVQGLGLGLDERAIEAVRKWKFRPATGPDRQPAATWVQVHVEFRQF